MSAEAARALLHSLGPGPADGVWSAPGRVNLIGEHTDYNGGFVLPFAIAERTSVAARLRDDERIRVASTFAEEVVEVALSELDALFPSAGAPAAPEWAAYPLGVAWALRAATEGRAHRGVDLAFDSDVPVGAGLSSSAAIEGAAASALNDLWDLGLAPAALAQAGRKAENEAVGAPTGIMDQTAAMLGERGAAIFLDCLSLETALVPLAIEDEGLAILVIDTRVRHAHATGGYRDRRASCEQGARALGVPSLRDVGMTDLPRAVGVLDEVTFRRVRHIITENQRVLDTVAALRTDGARSIGPLLTASHASMRDDFEISIPELDTAVDTALAAGALGARMTGGGFGGAAIALMEQDAVDAVGSAVAAAFVEAGFRAPHLFTVAPSRGAGRDS